MAKLNPNSTVGSNTIWHEGNLNPEDLGGGYTSHITDTAYGGDPTGTNPADAAFDSMVADASEGDVLSIGNATVRLDDYHDIPKPVTIDGTGGSIVASQYNGDKATLDQSAMFDSEEAVLSFTGTQTTTTTTTAASHRESDDRISVTDATNFAVGDDLLIRRAGDAILNRSYQPTRTRIRSIDGTDLYLTNSLKYSYDSGSEVIKIDPVVGGKFKNLTFEGGDPGNCLASRYSRGTVAYNCTVDGYYQHAIQFWDDLHSRAIDCYARNPHSRASSHGEAMRVVGSSDIGFVRPNVTDCRRGIDIRSGCKSVRVDTPDITNASLHGICYHNASGDDVYGSIEVYGGKVAGRSIDDATLATGEAHTGYGISSSSNAGHIYLNGVTVESRRNALAGGGNNIQADGCTFRSTYQTSTLYPTVDCSGTGIRLTDCTIETVGSRGTALRVSGDDIDVDGLRINPGKTTHGLWSQHPIRVDGAGRVSIDAQNVDWKSGTVPAVSIGTVDELSLSGDLDGPSGSEVTAITADGAVSNLSLDDLRSSAKIDISGATSIGELWLGMVDTPSIAYGTPSTVRSAYGL